MTSIPSWPRYQQATLKAHAVLADYQIDNFPEDLFALCKKIGIKLKKYSTIARKTGTTIQDVSTEFKSTRGWIYRNPKGKYFIAYNDLNDSAIIRFTIAHELGHFFMNHLEDFEETELRYLSTDRITAKHKVLENEASCFGRNLVAPVPLSTLFSQPSLLDLSAFFGIGYKAAKVRLDLLPLDSEYYSKFEQEDKYGNQLKFHSHLLLQYSEMRHCDTCGGEFSLHGAEFCVFCGSKTLWKITAASLAIFKDFGGGTMIYSKIVLDEEMTPTRCPHCDAENLRGSYQYCPYCSTFLHNVCLGNENNKFVQTFEGTIELTLVERFERNDCSKDFLDGGFRYCPTCGSKTSFFEQQLLKDWSAEKNDLPF